MYREPIWRHRNIVFTTCEAETWNALCTLPLGLPSECVAPNKLLTEKSVCAHRPWPLLKMVNLKVIPKHAVAYTQQCVCLGLLGKAILIVLDSLLEEIQGHAQAEIRM